MEFLKTMFSMLFIFFGTTVLFAGCSKNIKTSLTNQIVAPTIGFFNDDWKPKSFVRPVYEDGLVPDATNALVTIDCADSITKIPLTIFGHNSNTWMGNFVGAPSLITDLTNLQPHIICWPAGSVSNGYFWNASPGAIPEGAPEKYIDKNEKEIDGCYGFGNTKDEWRASLHNYYQILDMTKTRGIITVNYGYARYGITENPVAAAAHLAAEWVRHDNGRTRYWEIGNENYADWEAGYRIDVSKNKDGQPEFQTGKLYAQHFKVFADSMHKAARDIGKIIKIGAVLQESEIQSWQQETTRTWNSTMIPEMKNRPDYYIVHNYITPYNENSTVATILNSATIVPSKMMDFVKVQLALYGSDIKPIAFTEWNMWAKDNKQQVSNISGLFAIIVQAESIKNLYGLTARRDLLNNWEEVNDHGLFSSGNEPNVPRCTARPSFYYLYFFQKCIGDKLLANLVSGNENIKAYSSSYNSGQTNVTLLNTSAIPQTVEINIKYGRTGNRYYWYTL